MTASCRNGIMRFALTGLVFMWLAFPRPLQAQTGCEELLSLNCTRQPLEDILDSITMVTGLKFAYNSSIIDSNDGAAFRVTNVGICKALDSLLGPFNLHWSRVENQIVIIRANTRFEAVVQEKVPQGMITVSGRVVDGTDGQPIPYAYIQLIGKSTGTITNNDGDFVFKYPVSNDRDIISVSCIGYKSLNLPLPEFSDHGNWELFPESILLKEVLVRSNDPRSIIRKAIEAIPRNYRSGPVNQTGFYRETLQRNGKYIVLSEAVVNIFKAAYNRPYQLDQVKVFKGRKHDDPSAYDTVLFKVQGGLVNSLLLDIAKNIPGFMDESSFPDYTYHMGLVQKVNDEEAYTIEFDQRDGVEDALYKGKLMVDVGSLAILGAEFSISPKGIKNAASVLVRKASLKVKVKPVSADYLVTYSKFNGYWQLNHIRMELKIRVKKKSDWFNSLFTSVSEMVITGTDTMNVQPFKATEKAHPNQVFVENVGPYDASFWGDFNYIKPEERLEEAIDKLSRKLQH